MMLRLSHVFACSATHVVVCNESVRKYIKLFNSSGTIIAYVPTDST